MIKIKCLLLFVLSLYSVFSIAQKERDFWFFGFNAGLNFNYGSPIPVINGQLNTWEGCSSISSSNGDLLFYTDGQFVYNANHQQMPNGSGLLGDESSTQSGIIIPKPGSTTEYYIFTVDDLAGTNGVRYTLVDMTLEGGFGDVVNSEKNVFLVGPTCEKISAVGHGNGTDYWMLTHLWDSDQFYAYEITSAGVNTSPVVSTVGPIIGKDTENSKGYMKFSPDGTKLALANNLAFTVDIFDFNNGSGQVSNHLGDPNYINPGAQGGPYGVGFSPDSKLLYISEWKEGKRIYQYDLTAGNGTAILDSRVIVASAGQTDYSFGALQLGPDNRLYIARWQDVPYLSVITNPIVYGPGCNFVVEGVDLQGRGSGYGLPNFPSKEIDNRPPNKPYNPQPADNFSLGGIDTTLFWSCSDLENDYISYSIYFDTIDEPQNLLTSGIADTFFILPSSLKENTDYFWRIIVSDTNNNLTNGDIWKFSTGIWKCGDTLKYENIHYSSIEIGNKCWMKENLNIGTQIDGKIDQLDNSIVEKYCYDDSKINCDKYGGLYQWNEMMQYTTLEKAEGICPNGWHIPSDNEWQIITNFLGGSDSAGGKLKEAGFDHWINPNTGATNQSGFTGLPGGTRHFDGNYMYIGYNGMFWSSTNFEETNAWRQKLSYNNDDLDRISATIERGYSVRCLKNSNLLFSIQTQSIPPDGGITNGDGTFQYGTEVTVNASANLGYVFLNWTEDGSIISTSSNYTFYLIEDRNLTANFTQSQIYSVSINSIPEEGGTIFGSGNYTEGETVTIKARPETGWNFIEWKENSSSLSTDTIYTFEINSNHTFEAHFERNVYGVSVSADPLSGGEVEGDSTYYYGDQATVKAIPNIGWTFVEWQVDGSLVSMEEEYSFTVIENIELKAIFTIESTLNLALESSTSEEICSGDTVVITGYPTGGAPPYTFEWSSLPAGVNGSDNSIEDAPGSSITYILNVTDEQENTLSDSLSIVVLPSPPANIVAKGSPPYVIICIDSGYYYQWYHENQMLEGETRQFYYPGSNGLSSGSYHVEVANVVGCTTKSNVFKANLKEEIGVWPNPNNGQFTLVIPGSSITEGSKCIVSIIDMTGNIVESVDYPPGLVNEPVIKNLTINRKGIFMLQLTTDETQISKKIVVF